MAALNDPRYRRLRARLRQARRAAGLTQVEAAARLGRTQQFISQCEAGDRRVDALDLGDFADLYRQSVAWLLGRTDDSPGGGARSGDLKSGRPLRRRARRS